MASVTGGTKVAAALAELSRKLNNGRKVVVKVGWVDKETYADGTPVAMVAAIQNFGAPARGIPARPTLSALVLQAPEWPDKLWRLLQANNMDVEKALDLMGFGLAADLEAIFTAANFAPLSKVTLLLRERFPTRDGMTSADVWKAFEDVAAGVEPQAGGHSVPLTWTGQMKRDIDHEVVK
jgi:hypothetical protein